MGIDKAKLYPTFLKSYERAARLRETVTRKHLDLPVDDDVTITHHGVTGKHLVAFGVLVLTGLLGVHALNLTAPRAPLPVNSAMSSPAIQEYEVTFWAEDGTEYEVQPIGGVE